MIKFLNNEVTSNIYKWMSGLTHSGNLIYITSSFIIIYNGTIFPNTAYILKSWYPLSTSGWAVVQITCTSFMREFWIYSFSVIFLGRVFVGSIGNIKNDCLFYWFIGEWIGARNKHIVWEPLRFSRQLFVSSPTPPPMNPYQRHSVRKLQLQW